MEKDNKDSVIVSNELLEQIVANDLKLDKQTMRITFDVKTMDNNKPLFQEMVVHVTNNHSTYSSSILQEHEETYHVNVTQMRRLFAEHFNKHPNDFIIIMDYKLDQRNINDEDKYFDIDKISIAPTPLDKTHSENIKVIREKALKDIFKKAPDASTYVTDFHKKP